MAYPQRISFFEAQSIIDETAGKQRLQTERVPLSRALNRVALEELAAAIPLPSFDNAAMDGYAIRAEDINAYGAAGFELIGEQYAGAQTRLQLAQGQCCRITTGAMLPEGCDTVLIKEDASEDSDSAKVKINPDIKLKMGANIRKAGEDILVGEVVTKRGQVLKAARLSLMAALGQHDVLCSKRPTVAIFTTGDELQSPGQPLKTGQIYDSNRVLLQNLLLAEGLEPVAWPVLPDEPERIETALKDAAFSFDVVITCGGVSAGEKDFLPAFLEKHGTIHFWKVRMKPGMPVLFGQIGNTVFLNLPGNPVSVLASFLSLGRRLLDGLQGRAEPRELLRVLLSQAVSKKHSRLEFMRGDLHINHQGVIEVTASPATGSHRMKAAAESNALILLPEGLADYPAGTVVKVLPYGRWLS
jgi:molybdopterin molybdotransferase